MSQPINAVNGAIRGLFPAERYQLHKARFDSDPIFIESPLWVQQRSAEL